MTSNSVFISNRVKSCRYDFIFIFLREEKKKLCEMIKDGAWAYDFFYIYRNDWSSFFSTPIANGIK